MLTSRCFFIGLVSSIDFAFALILAVDSCSSSLVDSVDEIDWAGV